MLEVRGLRVDYGKVRALQGISLNVAHGEIVALIGANGAGKSSTLNAICGIVKTSGGSLSFEGRSLDRQAPHDIARRGLIQVPEGRLIFTHLSIAENLRLGGHRLKNRAAVESRLRAVLALFPLLQERFEDNGASLSGGQAQLLALARGLMAEPKLLLLDEPSLGLAPIAAQTLFALIRRLREQGMTVLLVEQNVRQALALADRAYVLESGRIILQGKASELLDDAYLIRSYLGMQT